MLPDKEVGGVRQQEKHLQATNLGSQAKDLLTAELYMRHKLRLEAAQLYQSLADSSGSPAIWLALGRAYLEMGIPEQAHLAFAQALAFAQDTGEREVEAATLVGSGLASRLLNDDAAAEEALQGAKNVYTQIGDRQGVEEAERLLSE
jgi:tetratricopeptide (TPR) repeat protein